MRHLIVIHRNRYVEQFDIPDDYTPRAVAGWVKRIKALGTVVQAEVMGQSQPLAVLQDHVRRQEGLAKTVALQESLRRAIKATRATEDA